MANIIVIDDDELVRVTVRQILEKDGHLVAEAETGLIGLQKIAANLPDLVVTDIIMPDKEGIETILEIRKKYPKLKVIAMSGGGRLGRMSVLDVAKKFGADAVIAKPFDRQKFVETVKQVLAG